MKRARFRSPVWPFGLLAIAAVVAVSAAFAVTASNSVPTTVAGSSSNAVTAQELAPAACSSLTLNNIVLAPATPVTGTSNNLDLGTGSASTLGNDSNSATDCCVGTTGATNAFKASCAVKIGS